LATAINQHKLNELVSSVIDGIELEEEKQEPLYYGMTEA